MIPVASGMTSDNVKEQLQSLRPDSRVAVMDLLVEAGIDVSGWSRKEDGSALETPRANPKYCYEWSFGRGDEPRALCIWHDDLSITDGSIVSRGNMKALSIKLDIIAREKWRPAQVKTRARNQQKRAADFDFTLQRAARRNEPLRVILLAGQASKEMDLGWDTSTVDRRSLDPQPWMVESYSEDDGQFVLARSSSSAIGGNSEHLLSQRSSVPAQEAPSPDRIPAPTAASMAPSLVDQFDAPSAMREVHGEVHVRSAEVRRRVLLRSGGLCEWCGEAGFRTLAGAIYLETHHVVPLSEHGADSTANVIALCANDHRRAHFSEAAGDMRVSLLRRLATLQLLEVD